MCHPCDFASDTPMIIDVQILKHLHFETVYFPLLFSEIMKTTFFTNIFSLLRSSWSVKNYIYFMLEYLLNVFKMPGWNKINIFSCLKLKWMMWQIETGRQPCDYPGTFPAPHNQTITTLACLCINYKDVILYSVDDQNLIVP